MHLKIACFPSHFLAAQAANGGTQSGIQANGASRFKVFCQWFLRHKRPVKGLQAACRHTGKNQPAAYFLPSLAMRSYMRLARLSEPGWLSNTEPLPPESLDNFSKLVANGFGLKPLPVSKV